MSGDRFDIDGLRRYNRNLRPPSFTSGDTLEMEPVGSRRTRRPGCSGCTGCLRRLFSVALFLLLAFAVWRSFQVEPSAEQDVAPAETVTVTVTKTVTVTVTKEVRVEVPTLPEPCVDALALAAEMQPHMNKIVTQGGQVTDVLSKARMAIVEEDHQALVRLGNDVNKALNESTAATSALLDLQRRFDREIKACNTALGR